MPANNSYDKGPLHSRGWDEPNNDSQSQQPGYESGWGTGQNNFSSEDNRNRGGFTGTPGSNYAAAPFNASSQGMSYDEGQYRGYYGERNRARGFANAYSHSYGRDDYRRSEQQNVFRSKDDTSQAGEYSRQNRFTDPGDSGWGNRREEGLHRGKGPKNYQRSDSRIREDISERLTDDPYVDASDVEISVEQGNVVLKGRVHDRNARRRAVELAESVSGVVNVESHLRTGQSVVENISRAITAAIGDVTLGPGISKVEDPVEEPKKGRRRKL